MSKPITARTKSLNKAEIFFVSQQQVMCAFNAHAPPNNIYQKYTKLQTLTRHKNKNNNQILAQLHTHTQPSNCATIPKHHWEQFEPKNP